jgi:hypothetical protein
MLVKLRLSSQPRCSSPPTSYYPHTRPKLLNLFSLHIDASGTNKSRLFLINRTFKFCIVAEALKKILIKIFIIYIIQILEHKMAVFCLAASEKLVNFYHTTQHDNLKTAVFALTTMNTANVTLKHMFVAIQDRQALPG